MYNHTSTSPRSPFVARLIAQRTTATTRRRLLGRRLVTTDADGTVEERELVPQEVPAVLDGVFGIKLTPHDAATLAQLTTALVPDPDTLVPAPRKEDVSVFTPAERNYLHTERRLGRLATVGPRGTPHVTPVGWSWNEQLGAVEVRGVNLARTRKFRDVARHGRAAIVIDDVQPPWQPRGVEIRGRAEAVEEPEPTIRIHPERIIGWGLDDTRIGRRNARDVTAREGTQQDPPGS